MAESLALRVTAYPHPFSTDGRIDARLPCGLTPGEILDEVDWPIGRDHFTVFIVDGVEIHRREWDTVQIVEGGNVAIRLNPAGGGGNGGNKAILGMVAMIGLALIAPQLAGLVFTQGTLAATALAAGITVAGALALSALFKPPLPNINAQGSINTQYSITAQSNQITPYATIPRMYGRLRMFPRVAAIPYSVNLSGGNYLTAVYDFGYGPLQVEDIRIGATPLSSYQGVTFAIHPFWQEGDALTIFSGDQQSEAVSVTLNENNDQGTRRTAPGTSEVVIDLNFPAGLYAINSGGNPISWSAFFELAIDGVPISPATQATLRFGASHSGIFFNPAAVGFPGMIDIQGPGNRDPFSVSIWMTLPSAGEHDIRVRRHVLFKPPGYVYYAQWWQFRNVADQSVAALAVVPGHTILEIQVRANDQLSGTIDTLSAIVTSILPVWDGATWTPQPTRNPAWIFADILRGTANNRPVPDARIDLPTLLEWSHDCDAAAPNDPGVPQYCCDIIFDWAATVREALQTAAACGRASLTMRAGRFSVIRDIDPGPPVQLITKRNSWDFAASLPYLDRAHGLNITFFDDLTWTENTLKVYADGYNAANATLFEEIKLPGITRHNQAWRFGRYYLAEALLRRERATVTMDMENIIAARGDLVAVAHDVLRVGGFPARVVEVIGSQVRVDEPITFAGANAIRVRRSDVRGLGPIIGASVTGPATYTVADASQIAPGDLIVAGTTDVIVGDYIVDKVRPSQFPNASLELIESRPEVRSADIGPIPERVPKPGLEPDGSLASPAPLIALVNYAIKDGTRKYEVALNWTPSPLATLYRVMIQENGKWREIGTTRDTRFPYELAASEVVTGAAQFGVQAWSANGIGSEIATASVAFDPPNDPWPSPSPPSGITATPRENDVEIRWQAVVYDYIDFYKVRLGNSWDDFVGEWTNKTLVQSIPPQLAGDYKVWIKTVDRDGRESATVAGPATFTVISPLQVSIVGMTVTNTAYLRWGSLAIGDPGWTAQTTHGIAYFELAKALLAAPPPLGQLTPPLYRLRFPARRRDALEGGAPLSLRIGGDLPRELTEFEEAQGVGRSSTEFSVLPEQQEGSWRYGVRAVDVAGNFAPWAFIDLLLTPPDNYYLLDHVDDIVPLSIPDDALGFDGVFTMALGPSYLMPYETAQTWQSHFVDYGFATPQAQVDAGFPLFAQPPDPQGSLTFEHDYVDTIPQVRLTLRPTFDVLALDPIVRGEVYTRLNAGDPWDLAFNGLVGVVPDNARYLRAVLIAEPGASGKGMVRMRGCDYTLDVHYVTDQGMDPVAAGGTFVPFHVAFSKVVAVQLTPASPGVAYCQFVIADPPTGLTLFAFDHTAAPVAGSISWTVRGY